MLFWFLLFCILLFCYLFIFWQFKNLVSLLFPLFVLLIYLYLGSPNFNSGLDLEKQSLADLIYQTEQVLKTSPDDIKGWSILANVYNSLGQTANRDRALANIKRIQQQTQEQQ